VSASSTFSPSGAECVEYRLPVLASREPLGNLLRIVSFPYGPLELFLASFDLSLPQPPLSRAIPRPPLGRRDGGRREEDLLDARTVGSLVRHLRPAHLVRHRPPLGPDVNIVTHRAPGQDGAADPEPRHDGFTKAWSVNPSPMLYRRSRARM